MDKPKMINFKLKKSCNKIIKIKRYKFSPYMKKSISQFEKEKNSQRNSLKIRIYHNCGKCVEIFVGKVFNVEIEFSTIKLNINLIND
ncbi:hypothetical protein HMPREF1552_00885 [Leptotrichia sp. oral taxon 879 str. F0557]|nr:hypothetical protein HMPREF1552_00885 [Leptotrichia sp. oral taxon 879 str. F0557]